MKILIVDDNQLLIDQMSKYLGKHGHAIVTALDGEKALKALQEEEFQVCITDMKMPGISGMELLSTIRGEYPQIQVVIMTAYGTAKTALQALKEGAFDFVHKPFQMEQITTILESLPELPEK